MVKIINTFGDVKTGKQGEAVYQGKYGQQMRRTVSPKRAIVSQRQIEHRLLYRAALDWRSQLSLPNRRYLDGYCIANWIIDTCNIPLPWSRFALKLYLEAVRFVLTGKPVAGIAGTAGRYEWYDDRQGDIGYRMTHWGAQTFTPAETHNISKVRLKCYRSHAEDIGNIIVSIRATDGSGHPTGGDLVAVVVPSLDIGTVPDTWHDFIFPTTPPLTATVKYAIVLRAPFTPVDRNINQARRFTTPAYPGGNVEDSVNGGGTWSLLAQDWSFEEYGLAAGTPPVLALLHARHPALLAVIHKRGALTVRAYDNLSSLDEEYITGQVGLDVETGDFITATTIAGLQYTYTVM